MKNLLIIMILIFSFSVKADDFKTNFTIKKFEKAQNINKTIIVSSWNKFCSTCAKQKPILKKAEKDFKDFLFLNYEQTKHPQFAKYLDIDYWTTIAVYKGNKQIAKTIGLQKKEEIYDLIKKAE